MWWIIFMKTIFCVFHIVSSQPAVKKSFSCDGRPSGYYADVSTGCQVYHMCDGIGRQFSYTCPNATLFQQRMLICDHWYMVNCTRAEADYGANLLIGQKKPFVEDTQYYRTPRPDLLTATRNETEANIIYRTGQKQTTRYVVGIEPKIGDLASENETTYFPPSHWSTSNVQDPVPTPSVRYSIGGTGRNVNSRKEAAKAISSKSFSNRNDDDFRNEKTNSIKVPPQVRNKPDTGNGQPNVVFGSKFKATTPVYPLSVDPTSEEPDEAGLLPPIDHLPVSNVNFASNFKATTPVYPTSVEPSSPNSNIGLLPPRNTVDKESNVQVNFDSNFKATTPVFPQSVDTASENPGELGLLPPQEGLTKDFNSNVNFESNFKATTPVYPNTVEPTSPNPDIVGLVPPNENSSPIVNFASNFKATTPVYPNSVESTSVDPSQAGLVPPQETRSGNIIFKSDYNATTPVYPTSVEERFQNTDEGGLLPPKESQNQSNIPSLVLEILPPKFDESSKFSRDPNIQISVSPPSKFYQAPKEDPDFTIKEVETNNQLGIRINNFMKSLSGSQWHNLREQFKIPEYDFPLEENGRPSYEGTLNSFDARQVKKKK